MTASLARVSGIFCLMLTATTAAVGAEVPDRTDAISGQHLVEMFQVGVASNSRATQESQRIYESLSAEAQNDPRIDYAYGLVLLKLMKTKDAQAQIHVATQRPGTVYRPAWQASIWWYFNTRSYDDGYKRLVEYTRFILDSEKFPADWQHDEIYWMGRLMSALELMPNTPQAHASWIEAEIQLTGLFGAKLIQAYVDGKQDMQIRHKLIEDKIRRELEKTEAQKSLKREKELQGKNKVLEAANETGENLKKSANEAKESRDEEAAAYKKQLQRSDKDLEFLQRRATLLTAEMLVLDEQIILLQNLKNANPNINSRISALQNQRFVKDLEFQRITVLAQEVSSNAQQLTVQRAELLDQNQRDSVERAEKEKNIETVKTRTIRQVAELKKSEANANVANAVEKQMATRTLRTYIDFDLAAERDKVLDSFGVKVAKK